MPPTKNHRPAIWECMLGAVYAMNDFGDVKYFDYRYEDALEWAGMNNANRDLDTRVFRNKKRCTYTNGKMSHAEPSFNQHVLWITKDQN
jgi:hypothetical protein